MQQRIDPVKLFDARATAGTITITWTTVCTGTGTSFLSTFRVGDSIIITDTAETKVISAIASDTVMTIAAATNEPSSAYTFLCSTVAFPVSDWQNVFIEAATGDTTTATIKFQISNAFDQPDFNSAASRTNPRSYVQVKELITNASVDWATGISRAGTDSVRNFEVNTNGQRRVWATITSYTAGTIDLELSAKNNS